MTLPEPGPVVIDTNIALDLLVFDNPDCLPLAAALASGELRWIATAPMRTELARVLGYPLIARRLGQRQMEAARVLEAFDARVQLLADTPPRAPCVCKDPDDQVFIDLAVAQRARLFSKDQAVLTMRKRLAAQGVVVATVLAAA
ncbi:putative toxin-antitoxin system toxin component, PIN family [Variovorax sp. ZS18.2.2]|uniref:putative toxin-antitoxin system toxin component, PIN family n=1 Tax=Variovorax sp. ZS18.2.2 TaxID=2971255 RepID=UPI0021517B71|nr:putative toxin-antitoxin system toxin component, PIN family [Variovorax sp. ZS18.2.2]MCR6478635.1 putative toxin-antitoxin system toxin component, PIN family [Variovorax sp. ZS18.2.2]